MILDEELLWHLRHPEKVLELRDLGVGPHLVDDKLKEVKSFVTFVFDYLEKYGNPPNDAVINEEWNIDFEEPTVDTAYLADRLKYRYVRTEQRSYLKNLAEVNDPDEFVNEFVKGAHKLWSEVAPSKHILTSDDFPELIHEFRNYAESGEQAATLGFPAIDEHTGGAGAGHLVFIVARPKRYKSWIQLKAFVEQRIQGFTPILFTLELTEKDMYKRLMCLVSGVSYSRMIKNTLMPAEWKKIEEAMTAFAMLGPAYIIHSPYDQRKISDFVLEVQKHKSDSVLIDQLSFIHPEKDNSQSDHKDTKEIVQSMKVAATKLNIPWIVNCQFNREAAALEDLAGADKIGLSRSIEETGDLIIALHRNDEEAELGLLRYRILEGRYCKSNEAWQIQVNLSQKTSFNYNGPVLSRASE